MNVRQPRYGKEEHARRGTEIYERLIRPQVETTSQGKIVSLDVDTGVFELAEDTVTAAEHLLLRFPDAQVWCVRVGKPAVHRFGAHTPKISK